MEEISHGPASSSITYTNFNVTGRSLLVSECFYFFHPVEAFQLSIHVNCPNFALETSILPLCISVPQKNTYNISTYPKYECYIATSFAKLFRLVLIHPLAPRSSTSIFF